VYSDLEALTNQFIRIRNGFLKGRWPLGKEEAVEIISLMIIGSYWLLRDQRPPKVEDLQIEDYLPMGLLRVQLEQPEIINQLVQEIRVHIGLIQDQVGQFEAMYYFIRQVKSLDYYSMKTFPIKFLCPVPCWSTSSDQTQKNNSSYQEKKIEFRSCLGRRNSKQKMVVDICDKSTAAQDQNVNVSSESKVQSEHQKTEKGFQSKILAIASNFSLLILSPLTNEIETLISLQDIQSVFVNGRKNNSPQQPKNCNLSEKISVRELPDHDHSKP